MEDAFNDQEYGLLGIVFQHQLIQRLTECRGQRKRAQRVTLLGNRVFGDQGEARLNPFKVFGQQPFNFGGKGADQQPVIKLTAVQQGEAVVVLCFIFRRNGLRLIVRFVQHIEAIFQITEDLLA